MKHKANQFDLPGLENAFNLAGETLPDEPEHFTEYLCGCKYPSAYDAYHDRHCATCHRQLWMEPKAKTQWKVRMDKHRSTWNWFTTNPQGGGFGSNHCGTKRVALQSAIRSIPQGESYELITNGKSTIEVA